MASVVAIMQPPRRRTFELRTCCPLLAGARAATENKEVEDKENEDTNKAKKDSVSKWTTPEVIAAVYAVLAADRKKADQTMVARATAFVEFYRKMAVDLIETRVWVPYGKEGHPSLDASVKFRTTYPLSGKNKGKCPMYTKFKEALKLFKTLSYPLL